MTPVRSQAVLFATTLSLLTAPADTFGPHLPPHLTRHVVPPIHPTGKEHSRNKHGRNLSQLSTPRPATKLYNLLTDLTNLLTNNGGVEPETELPYHPPFSDELSIASGERTFAVRERASMFGKLEYTPLIGQFVDIDIARQLCMVTICYDSHIVTLSRYTATPIHRITFTGEDFDILDISDAQTDFVRVRGAMLHLPGKDKMRISSSSTGQTFVTMDRVLIAATPSYDLYRHNADGSMEKIGWIEKKLISFMDTFDVYMEGKGGFGVTGLFKPTPAYRIEGDFLDRNFSFKNAQGKTVARANMDGWIQLDMMNHYQVRVGEGMDALLVLACVCCIDEEFDEEHKKRKEEREQ
ncbi:hypothetical protein HJC23_001441 [Cyclotella cryptica]|uniref:Phospholipid scramblase n=1 Tax=Cyclotella cryptica TaxID=29204 RepID=A0ABD3NYU3_9STRA|eukprot:CCRYP_018666-RA/>CCRYP_018666-RA protein AED:0.07 eAED:0.07 QI:114/0.5/0.66/1/1/1/3/183/351